MSDTKKFPAIGLLVVFGVGSAAAAVSLAGFGWLMVKQGLTQEAAAPLATAAVCLGSFLSGLLMFILSTSRRDRARVLVSMKSSGLLFSVVLLAHQKLFLFGRQVPAAKLMFANPDENFLPRFQLQVPNAARNFWMALQNFIAVVPVHNGAVPNKDRGQQLPFCQNVFFQLPSFLLGQGRNLCLEFGVNAQCLCHATLLPVSGGVRTAEAWTPDFAVRC